jgi:FAD dependent oxidoreductase
MISRIAAAVLASLIFCTCFPPVAVDAARGPDVLVVGGTPAGVAAAVAAARHGENVTLVATRPVFGGVMTDATMDQWDLNLAPNSDTEVEGGIFREIYAELGDSFSPGEAAKVFGNLVASEARIHTIVNATASSVRVSGPDGARHIDDVTFSHAGGEPFTVAADMVIDATDDGDVAALAGARYDLGRQDTGIDEKMQAVTLMFTIDGVNWTDVLRDYDPAKYGPGGALDDRAWGYSKLMDAYGPSSPDVLVRDLNLGHEADGSVSVNAIDVIGIDGLLPNDLIRARVLAESEAPRVVDYLREHLAGFADARVGRFADAIYVRETRHVLGDEWLTADDVWDGVMPADRIGLSSYPLDLHPVTATDKLAYAAVRHVYGIPLGTLLPKGFTNLMLASPAISASHEASGSARVIPTTIEEGEAAGAATALARERHVSLATFATTPDDVAALQTDLRDHGALLDYKAPEPVANRHRKAERVRSRLARVG